MPAAMSTGADRGADLAGVVAPRGELRRAACPRSCSGMSSDRAVAVAVGEHLAAALGDETLDDTRLIRCSARGARAPRRRRARASTLSFSGGNTEAQHGVAQRIVGTGQQRSHAVPSGDPRARRAHVSPRRRGCPRGCSSPASRFGTITRRLKMQTRSPRWLNARVSTVTIPRSGLLDDSRFSSTVVSA